VLLRFRRRELPKQVTTTTVILLPDQSIDFVRCRHPGVLRRFGMQPERCIHLEHKYTIGQIIELMPSCSRAAATGEYEIRQTMPAPDNNSASPRYRIKSAAEKHDRIVPESDIIILPLGEPLKVRPVIARIQLPVMDN
jgi:hypothetical protein